MPTLLGTETNPVADAYCLEHGSRIEALAEMLWPSVEVDRPSGIEFDEGGESRTSTDDESRTIRFAVLEKFAITGGDRLEERTAEDLEEVAAVLLELAGRVRSELVLPIDGQLQ